MDLSAASKTALGLVKPLGKETIEVEKSLGRVLAEDVYAERNIPQEARSRLDGYAIRSCDSSDASVETPVLLNIKTGMLTAGHIAKVSIRTGECVKVLTGAPVPSSADAVVPQEETSYVGDRLCIKRSYPCGFGIQNPGEDACRGERLLTSGTLLRPTCLGVLAALGENMVKVYRRPKVAFLGTGDELVKLGETPDGPCSFCNGIHLLAWLTEIHGGVPSEMHLAGDDVHSISRCLGDLDADLIISTGGMGGSSRDYVLDAWRHLGIEKVFHGIDLSPGRYTALGLKDGRLFWGLPGNPWAAQVVFLELVAPLIRRMQGLEGFEKLSIKARLEKPLSNRYHDTKVIRGRLDWESMPVAFIPETGARGSFLSKMLECVGYILLKGPVVEMAAGREVEVHLPDFPLLSYPALNAWRGGKRG